MGKFQNVGLPYLTPCREGSGFGVGWTGDQCTPTAQQTEDFLGGWGANIGAGVGMTWASPHQPGNNLPSRAGGNVQTPGAGIGYNWRL